MAYEAADTRGRGLRNSRREIGLVAVVRRLDWLLFGATLALVGYGLWAIDGITMHDAGGSSMTRQALYVFAGGLVFIGALSAYLLLSGIEAFVRGRAERARKAGAGGAHLALLISIGIGLHNLGEGLAIGSAYAIGSLALGTFLVVGFAIHNTTEGLAIVAPLAEPGASRAESEWWRGRASGSASPPQLQAPLMCLAPSTIRSTPGGSPGSADGPPPSATRGR